MRNRILEFSVFGLLVVALSGCQAHSHKPAGSGDTAGAAHAGTALTEAENWVLGHYVQPKEKCIPDVGVFYDNNEIMVLTKDGGQSRRRAQYKKLDENRILVKERWGDDPAIDVIATRKGNMIQMYNTDNKMTFTFRRCQN